MSYAESMGRIDWGISFLLEREREGGERERDRERREERDTKRDRSVERDER